MDGIWMEYVDEYGDFLRGAVLSFCYTCATRSRRFPGIPRIQAVHRGNVARKEMKETQRRKVGQIQGNWQLDLFPTMGSSNLFPETPNPIYWGICEETHVNHMGILIKIKWRPQDGCRQLWRFLHTRSPRYLHVHM